MRPEWTRFVPADTYAAMSLNMRAILKKVDLDDADLPEPPTIRLRRARVARILGVTIDDATISDILSRLGMALAPTEANTVPPDEDAMKAAPAPSFASQPTTTPRPGW